MSFRDRGLWAAIFIAVAAFVVVLGQVYLRNATTLGSVGVAIGDGLGAAERQLASHGFARDEGAGRNMDPETASCAQRRAEPSQVVLVYNNTGWPSGVVCLIVEDSRVVHGGVGYVWFDL